MRVDVVLRRLATAGALLVLGGCGRVPLLDPKGPVGDSERVVIIVAFLLMLLVVVPVQILAFRFARKYRASNPDARYEPKWGHSLRLELVVWLVPVAIVTALGYLAWTRTLELDPDKPIDSAARPVRVDAVSLDWKWLFIYPDQDIAVVNELVFPAGVPLNLRITSGTVMTSFFIPQLGSQIYGMGGMVTRLHLLADEPGTYAGKNQQYSGAGYSDMTFDAIAKSPAEFADWVQKVKQSPDRLDAARYQRLAQPTKGYPVTYFGSVTSGLFDDVVDQYCPSAVGREHRSKIGVGERGK